MRKIGNILVCTLLFMSCGEEKTTLEQAIEQKCACLELLNEEKSNVLEVLNCSDEIANKAEFAQLDPEDIAEGMEKFCPNAALPYEQMPQ